MSTWDFFALGRVAFLCEKSNTFFEGSELCRTGSVPAAAVVPNSDIMQITDNAEDLDDHSQKITASTRSSQRGPSMHANLLRALLSTSKLSKVPMINAGSHLDIIDVNVHSGDRLLATQQVAMETSSVSMRHCLVSVNSSTTSLRSVGLAQKRLGQAVAKKWLQGSMELLDENNKAVPATRDFSSVTEDDMSQMKLIPGVWEAYMGVSQMHLDVAEIHGSSLRIGSALATFAGAPACVKSELDTLCEHFIENYGDKLKGVLGAAAASEQSQGLDPRDGEEPVDAQTATSCAESEAALRSSINATVDCKAADHRKVTLLGDDNGILYIVSKDFYSNI